MLKLRLPYTEDGSTIHEVEVIEVDRVKLSSEGIYWEIRDAGEVIDGSVSWDEVLRAKLDGNSLAWVE